MNEKTKKRLVKLMLSLSLLMAICMNRQSAFAQENLLKEIHADMYVGASLQLSDYFNDLKYSDIKYAIADTSINKNCVKVSSKGKITAVEVGEAVVTVTYVIKNADETDQENADEDQETQNQEKTEDFTVSVHDVENVAAAYGSHVHLQAFTYYAPSQTEYAFSNNSAILSNLSDVWVQGFSSVEVYVTQGDEKFIVARITVVAPTLTKSTVARAVGTTGYKPDVTGYTPVGGEIISYESKNAGVATSTEGISAVTVGTYSVEVKIKAANGDYVALPLTVVVTNPVFDITNLVVAKGIKTTVTLSGTSEYSVIENNAAKSGVAYFKDNKTIYANAEGSKNVALTVDGKDIIVAVIVTNPRFTQNAVAMYKGLGKTLSISGLNKTYSKITYSSANKKIVTITKNGTMKAKKVGVAYIQVTADGKTFKVLVQISTKKAYQAAKKEIAISKRKTTYSQYRRMQKNYYDCSSLVSRVYRKYGQYFGSKRGWSPTAAGIGSWCTSNKKVLYKKGVSYKNLVPGDLIFYSYEKNGRYRNISHIEMYVGNGMSVSASSSRGKVVHYGYGSRCVVLIARPTK